MSDVRFHDLGGGRGLIDLGFRGSDGLIASYLLPQPDGWALVETGPSTCRTRLLEGLGEAGVGLSDVRSVLVTHIHLDHAGAIGALAGDLPNARFYVHRAGADHLIDPRRLNASAQRAWGARAGSLFGPLLPVPAERVVPLDGGEALPVQGGRLLAVATPGHARHHLAFFDEAEGALLTGDAAGVRLAGAWRPRPAIPPPDLDLDLLFGSLERMASLRPRRLLLSHFGESPGGVDDLRRYREAVGSWRDAALAAAREDPSLAHVSTALRDAELAAARSAGVRVDESESRSDLVSDYGLAAQGLLRYFQTHGLLTE